MNSSFLYHAWGLYHHKCLQEEYKGNTIICLHQNGYPPQYNGEVIDQVMEQVEHFKEHGGE